MKKKLLFIPLLAVITGINALAQPAIKQQTSPLGTKADFFRCLLIPNDGGFIAAGTSNSTIVDKLDYDYWIIKYNYEGTILWQKTIGGNGSDELQDIRQTKDSGYVMIGVKRESSPGYSDYWMVKMDKNRNIQWDKTFGGSLNDVATSVRQTEDSGYIIGGWSLSGISGDKTENNKGLSDLWIIKTDKTGNIQWQKTIGGSGNDGTYSYGSDYGVVIALPLSDGGYLIGSTSESNISGDKTANNRGLSDYWLIRLNNNGDILWDKTIGGNRYDEFSTLNTTKDGGYILGGSSGSDSSGEKTENGRGNYDYWIVKLNSAAEIEWNKTIGGNELDWLTALDKTSDGYILGGNSNSAGHTGEKTEGRRGLQGYFDYWVVKIDTQGNYQWDKTIGGSKEDHLYGIKEVKKDRYIIGGWSTSDISADKTTALNGDFDFWLVALAFRNNHVIATSNISVPLQKSNTKYSFTIYPNPAKDILHIQNTGKATFILTNQSGKILLTKTINGNGEINVAHLPTGLYYLKNNETGAVQKIVVIK